MMRRFIAATSLVAIAVMPAFAVELGAPYEELNTERALPVVADMHANLNLYVRDSSAPFENLTLDRALPELPQEAAPVQLADAASLATPRADVGTASPEISFVSPWINDHNFIAPAQ